MSIKKILFSMLLAGTALFGQNECASPVQANGAVFRSDGTFDLAASDRTKLWECPSLQNVSFGNNNTYPFTHKLKHIDFTSGEYVCDYNYAQSGQYKQSCKFTSQLYRGMKNVTTGVLKGKLKADGTPAMGLLDSDSNINLNQFDYLGVTPYPPTMITAQSDFNQLRNEIIGIEASIKFDPSNPNRESEAARKAIRNGYQKKFTNIESDLLKLQGIVNKHLIDPYINPSSTDIRKGYTLSNFVAGLITLDPNVVHGYDPNNGEILISQTWKNKASLISTEDPSGFINTVTSAVSSAWESILSLFHTSTDAEEAENAQLEISKKIYGGDVQFKIYSYAKVFEEKLWGFYYLLQERFDIGYNALASTLLFLFGFWFLFTTGTQEGIKYLTKKDEYETRMSEVGYVKTLLVLVTLGVFFISIPSGINDKKDTTGQFKSNAMRKNYTIAKSLIRQTASLGANTATMFADLGLSAFSQYIVKRQMMLSVDEIKKELEGSIEDIYMYPPALELRRECRVYYNSPSDEAFFDSIDDANFPINEAWKNSSYATKKNISALSYDVCMTAYKLYAIMPYQIGHAKATAEEQLRKADGKLSEATFLMTYNNIALAEKMGWISAFGYPLEYFILKKNDMFLSEEMDADRIKEESEKYMSTLLKDRKDMERVGMGGTAQDATASATATAISKVNYLYIHNILPLFSDIQKGIYSYFEKVYESKYQLWLKRNESKTKSLRETVKAYAKKITSKFGRRMLVIITGFFSNAIGSSTVWHTGLLFLSYLVAIGIWKMTFSIIFVILVSMMFLISFIMYFFDLLVHFTTSLFMFVWAFGKTSTGHGEGKIKEWLKNTIIIVYLKPSILIFGGFMFIFLYELTMTLYHLVFTSVTSNLLASVSLMSAANSRTGLFDSISGYSSIMAMQTIADVVVDLFGLYLAFVVILKIPAVISKKLGADSDDASHNQSITEQIQGKQERHTNPMG